MPEVAYLFKLGNASVVGPAGHGKTEIISSVAAMGRRALILTHTHAGVHALRARLKRLGVPYARVAVDTIAGWSMKYAHSFPGVAQPPEGIPQGAQWDQVYQGATLALNISAIREVVSASYDRILIDEYQDCTSLQHELATSLSSVVPTLAFGDPMQGIFEFAGASLNWTDQIYPQFPLAGTLATPHRWRAKNSALGEWIAETRERLLRGAAIDLADPRIIYRESDDAFDMGALFEGVEGKEGTFAAIHCNKGLCYRIAKAAGGGYQAIEEMAANRLREFAEAWDLSSDGVSRLQAISRLLTDSFHKGSIDDVAVHLEAAAIEASLREMESFLGAENGANAAAQFMQLSRKHPRWKLFRGELWRDAERAAAEVASGRADSMLTATAGVRQRVSIVGRKLPKRTVSTPLLLKGLEFDHVVIPDATHFERERYAQAKLFYVAISRAMHSLTITSSERWLRLPAPSI
jgi:AAA domain/UvrD-like helicase C-terminal domain